MGAGQPAVLYHHLVKNCTALDTALDTVLREASKLRKKMVKVGILFLDPVGLTFMHQYSILY